MDKRLFLRSLTCAFIAAPTAAVTAKLLQPNTADKPRANAYDNMVKTGVLRCGYFVWPPYVSLNPNTGTLSGLMIDLNNALAALLDVKIEYVESLLGSQIQDLATQKIDTHGFDSPITFAAAKYADYSRPFFYVPVYPYVRADDRRLQTFDDLNQPGVTFAALDGDLSQTLALKHFKKARVTSHPASTDVGQILLDITGQKADVFILEPMTVANFMANNPGHKLRPIGTTPLMTFPIAHSQDKHDSRLLSTLSQGIAMLHLEGEVDRLLRIYDPNSAYFVKVRPDFA